MLISIATDSLTYEAVGMKMLPLGIGIAVIALATMKQYGGRGGAFHVSPTLRDDEEFKRWRQKEKPLREITYAVILSVVLLAITGAVFVFS